VATIGEGCGHVWEDREEIAVNYGIPLPPRRMPLGSETLKARPYTAIADKAHL